MSVQTAIRGRDLPLRGSLLALLLPLLGLAAGGCYPSAGMVSGPSSDRPVGEPARPGVEGRVLLTGDLSSEGIAVLMIWTEGEPVVPAGGGIEAEKLAVPVAEGETPQAARVAATRTGTRGEFSLARPAPGAATLRVGALPPNCRRPRDQLVELSPGATAQVQIDVLCYVPKAGPIQ